MFASGLLALGGMLYARYADGRQLVYGLITVGAGAGLMLCALAARVLGRRLWNPGVLGPFLALTAVGAALLRLFLIASRPRPTEGPLQIVMTREMLIGAPLAMSCFSLLLGSYAVYRAISLPPGGLSERGPRLDLLGGIAALAASLYTLGPLLTSLGVPLNHWTFLGLVALGVLAFALVSLYEKIFG